MNEGQIPKRPSVKYDYMNPFEVYIESKEINKNLGNYGTLGLAKFIFDKQINGV